MKKFVLFAAHSLVALTVFACRTAHQPDPLEDIDELVDTTPAQSLSPVPDSLEIQCTQGGGVTGFWGGYKFFADGSVWSGSGMAGGEQMELAGQAHPDSIQILWNLLEDMRFFDIDRQEYANMTAVIEVKTAEKTHRVSWPPGVYGVDAMESPLDAFLVRCNAIGSEVEE